MNSLTLGVCQAFARRNEEEFAILPEKLNVVPGLFHGFDCSGYETRAVQLLVPEANHVLGLTDGPRCLLNTMTLLTKAHALSAH